MRAFGYIATAATTEAAVNGTTYTEPTVGAQRSVKSGSANDTAAGTGIRSVRIVYYTLAADGTIAGPFSEIVALNGVTAVPTVNTNICLIDRVEAVTVGSGGVAAGIITLATDNAGTGAICTIAAGERRTYMAHAYVPNGRRLNITDVTLDSGEVATVETRFDLRALGYNTNPPTAVEAAITNGLRAQGLSGAWQIFGQSGPLAVVSGPARVQLYTTPGAATAAVQRGDFGYYLS